VPIKGGTVPDAQSRDIIEFGAQILHLLEHTRTSATYKYAVLLAMMDLCIAEQNRHGKAKDSITTIQLAEKVMELYWPHTLPFPGTARLVPTQNSGPREAVILTKIREYKTNSFGSTTSFATAKSKSEYKENYVELRNLVEWKLIEMPLPKLQRLGHGATNLIYSITWDDHIKEARVRRYQEGDTNTGFQNLILFKPDVPDYLVTLSGLLRPLIHRNWASMVARLNKRHFNEARLEEYLFGAGRVSLTPVAGTLREIHNDYCFYCEKKLSNSCHVDHFIPWARYPDNGIANLVVAHSACNGSKSDFLASDIVEIIPGIHRNRCQITTSGGWSKPCWQTNSSSSDRPLSSPSANPPSSALITRTNAAQLR
jgi:hypothetical protein